MRLGWSLYCWGWCGMQVLGLSIFFFYRTIPFIANQTGEWDEPQKLATFREASRDHSLLLYRRGGPLFDEARDLPLELTPDYVHGVEPIPALTLPMIAGFPLQPGTGTYLAGGFPSIYTPRPGEDYVGSYDPAHRRVSKSFTSRPFVPQAPYIIMDVMLDKGAHFSFYRAPGVTLSLVDQTTGSRLSLIPRLEHTFPSFFRDMESVYARVVPGHTYVIESTAEDATPQQWIAFADPVEAGWLTPLTVGATQSGKLLCLLALGLFVFAAGLHRNALGIFVPSDFDEPKPARPGAGAR